MAKSTVWNVFTMILTLIVSLMAWTLIIGVKQSGYNSPSMFNNYSIFKEIVWSTAEKAYIERYALYSEDSGKQYYDRTKDIWNSCAGTAYSDSRSTCSLEP